MPSERAQENAGLTHCNKFIKASANLRPSRDNQLALNKRHKSVLALGYRSIVALDGVCEEMLSANSSRLRTEFVAHYDGLLKSLTRRLGSSDFAAEALHDTYLRMDRVKDVVIVHSPTDFIFQAAVNIAKDRRRARNRHRKTFVAEALLEICDDQPGPARVVEARLEVEAVRKALDKLPERPRHVFRSISMEGNSHRQVAANLHVSLRTVESDFKLALMHCADHVGRPLPRRRGGPRPCL